MTTPGKDKSKRTPERTTDTGDAPPEERNPMRNPDAPELDDDDDPDGDGDGDRDRDRDDEGGVPDASENDRETGPIERGKREPR